MSSLYSFLLSEISDPNAPAELWQTLESGSCGSFFTSWQWIGTWLRTMPANIRPMLLTVRQGGTGVAAAILVVQKKSRARMFASRRAFFNTTGLAAFDNITIEHNGFITQEDNIDQLWGEFLSWIAAQDFGELVISGLSSMPSKTNLIIDREEKTGYSRIHLLALKTNGLLPTLSRNTRQQISKAVRVLQGIGDLKISIASGTSETLNYFEEMKKLHIQSWSNRKRSHAFAHPYFEVFHRRLIGDHAKNGAVQMLRITAGEKVVGYLYNFRYRDKIFAYQSGFNVELSSLKPGYVCHTLAMHHYAKAGTHTYDFLAGTNQLKQSLSNDQYKLFWVRAGQKNLLTRATAAARKFLQQKHQGD